MRISDWSSDVCSSDLLFARSYLSGLVLFSLAALAQGGTYTPGIMLIADRYPPERRGAALGWPIASPPLGYALSLVLSGWVVGLAGHELAFSATAIRSVIHWAVAAPGLPAPPHAGTPPQPPT